MKPGDVDAVLVDLQRRNEQLVRRVDNLEEAVAALVVRNRGATPTERRPWWERMRSITRDRSP